MMQGEKELEKVIENVIILHTDEGNMGNYSTNIDFHHEWDSSDFDKFIRTSCF